MKLVIMNIKVLITAFLFLLPLLIFAQDNKMPDNFSISVTEKQLSELVNELRTENGLSKLQLSKALSYVGRTHAKDLFNNNPDTSICNMSSWSNKGDWTSCCHSKHLPNPDCILKKPSELTDYKNEGHELVYWEPVNVDPNSVYEFWKSIKLTSDFFLNEEQWSNYNWKAIGVGIYGGYACIWVGENFDSDSEMVVQKDPVSSSSDEITIIDRKQNRFYIIASSLTKIHNAKTNAKKLIRDGYKSTKIIKGSSTNIRISINDFSTLKEAKSWKKSLPKKYKDAWILNY
jgi:hypothetical protein